MKISLALCAFALIMAIVPATVGQVSSAALLGEVSDEAAAALPGVKVTARHEATGFSRSVVTSGDGG